MLVVKATVHESGISQTFGKNAPPAAAGNPPPSACIYLQDHHIVPEGDRILNCAPEEFGY